MKLTKNQQLYNDLIIKLLSELYNNLDVNNIYKNIKKDREVILDKISRITLTYTVDSSSMAISVGDRDKLYKDLSAIIDDLYKEEITTEKKLITKVLKESAKDRYGINNYILSLGMSFKLKKIADKELDKIIKATVKGKNYSSRIWDNKNQIAKVLKSDIKKFLNGEIDVNSIEKKIKDRFNSNAYNSKRLVETEVARVMEESNNKWQEDRNIEYVMYCATLDNKTCDKCKQYDSKVYKKGEEPVKLPQHPLDRCTYVALPSKDWSPKTRLDNKTKENINWQSYKEWISSN